MQLIKNLAVTFIVTIAATLIVQAQQADHWEWMNPKPQGNSIFANDFVDDNNGYAVGMYGTLLKTGDGGSSWNKVNSGGYPSTTVRFQIPQAGLVRLKVFDVLGREGATFADEEKSSGSYSVRRDRGSVASGVCLYRTEFEGVAKVDRTVLLR